MNISHAANKKQKRFNRAVRQLAAVKNQLTIAATKDEVSHNVTDVSDLLRKKNHLEQIIKEGV